MSERELALTVGQLREALQGVDDRLLVTLRTSDDQECGHCRHPQSVDICCGVRSAAVEDNCGGLHFAIDGDTMLEDPSEPQSEP